MSDESVWRLEFKVPPFVDPKALEAAIVESMGFFVGLSMTEKIECDVTARNSDNEIFEEWSTVGQVQHEGPPARRARHRASTATPDGVSRRLAQQRSEEKE